MPPSDLRRASLHGALCYTARFGLNKSQGTYFYHIVQTSPHGTYLTDLKHVSQPPSTSPLGRLLREACGTSPQLIPHEPVRENTQLHHASRMEAPTVPTDHSALDNEHTRIREPALPPASQPSVQPLPSSIPPLGANARPYIQPWVTETHSSFTPALGATHLPNQHQTPTHPEPVQLDDMDCLPPSPFLSSDVDMDILTDKPAPPSYDHTPWIPFSEHIPAPPFHSTFIPPQPATGWHNPYKEQPPFENQPNTGFAAPTPLYTSLDLPRGGIVPVAPEPLVDFSNVNGLPAYHLYPVHPGNDGNALELDWKKEADTSHSTSIAMLLDDFERSLTLVADETLKSKTDDPQAVPESMTLQTNTPSLDVPLVTHDLKSDSNPVSGPDAHAHNDSPPLKRDTESGKDDSTRRKPRPLKRESAVYLDEEPTDESDDEPPTYTPLGTLGTPASHSTPLARTCPLARPPTPPTRCRPVGGESLDISTGAGAGMDEDRRLRAMRIAALAQIAIEAKRAADSNKPESERIDPSVLRSFAMRWMVKRLLREEEAKTQQTEVQETVAEPEPEDTHPKRRTHTKRTRFVVPDSDVPEIDAGDAIPAGVVAAGTGRPSLLARARLCRRARGHAAGKGVEDTDAAASGTSAGGSRRFGGTGPLRSILRNARMGAMPYHKPGAGGVGARHGHGHGHATRRASMP